MFVSYKKKKPAIVDTEAVINFGVGSTCTTYRVVGMPIPTTYVAEEGSKAETPANKFEGGPHKAVVLFATGSTDTSCQQSTPEQKLGKTSIPKKYFELTPRPRGDVLIAVN